MKDVNGNAIHAKPCAKYLGQIFNEDNELTVLIDKRIFCKLIGLMRNNKRLARRARIRLFQTYMRIKINHLISMAAIAGDLKQMWKAI